MKVENKPIKTVSKARELFAEAQKSVLFISYVPTPRAFKLAWGLRRLGWKVGYIYQIPTIHDMEPYFDVLLNISADECLYSIATSLAPHIYHIFGGCADKNVLMFCRNKPGPVVIDVHDLSSPSLDANPQAQRDAAEALFLADGLCARDLRAKVARDTDRIPMPDTLLFPEFCWNTEIVSDIAKRPSDEVHVVNVGSFTLEKHNQFDTGHLRIAKRFAELGIHLHIFTGWYVLTDYEQQHAGFLYDFSDYLELQERTKYIHVHQTLPHTAMESILPSFDFGLFTGGCPDLGQHGTIISQACYSTCYAGRIANYLDARLPVLVNSELRFSARLLKHYGMHVDARGMLDDGFKKTLLALKNDPVRTAAAERAAQRFSIAAHVPRLEAFYLERIARGAKLATWTPPTVDAASPPPATPPTPRMIVVGALRRYLPPPLFNLLKRIKQKYNFRI